MEEENKVLTFELNINEANTVLAGLGELKASQSMDLINKFRDQAKAQLESNAEFEPVDE